MASALACIKITKEEMLSYRNGIEKEVNTVEVEEVNQMLKKYDIILKGDTEEEVDLILKYETVYDQLNEFVINKRNQIKDIEKAIKTNLELKNDSHFASIVDKKKDNINKIIECDNRIVERIEELETVIYERKMKELKSMVVERYDVDREMLIISNSMSLLKEWSNKNTSKVVFDSEIDGDGINKAIPKEYRGDFLHSFFSGSERRDNVLHEKVWNKNNLYFITFDDRNNAFGCFINSVIDKSDDFKPEYIRDKNAFIVSLIRNDKEKNKRYFLKKDRVDAFALYRDHESGWVYKIGNEIFINRVGGRGSWSTINKNNFNFDYENEINPLVDISYPERFQVKRIIVLQMN